MKKCILKSLSEDAKSRHFANKNSHSIRPWYHSHWNKRKKSDWQVLGEYSLYMTLNKI